MSAFPASGTALSQAPPGAIPVNSGISSGMKPFTTQNGQIGYYQIPFPNPWQQTMGQSPPMNSMPQGPGMMGQPMPQMAPTMPQMGQPMPQMGPMSSMPPMRPNMPPQMYRGGPPMMMGGGQMPNYNMGGSYQMGKRFPS